MKKYVSVILIVLFVFVSLAAAQSCGDKKCCADKKCAKCDAKSLIAQEKAVWEAYKSKDAKALSNLLAEDSYEVDEEGEILNKQEQLQNVKDLTISEYQMKDVQVVVVSPAVVVVRYKVMVKGSYKGEELTPKWGVASSMWVKRDARWVNVVYQQTPIAAKE